jgi:hypothetical protein
MKQRDIEELPKLKEELLENIFTVHQENDGMYFYNLLQTIEFPKDLPEAYFDFYNIKYGDTWPLISFKVYETPNLWWLILLANDIVNPLLPLEPGTILKIPNNLISREVLKQIIR